MKKVPPRKEIVEALEDALGNRDDTARILGVSRRVLYSWMKGYGIDQQDVNIILIKQSVRHSPPYSKE
jgi:DNA-binding NtrC family response regulator